MEFLTKLGACVGGGIYWGRDAAASAMIPHASSTSKSPVHSQYRCMSHTTFLRDGPCAQRLSRKAKQAVHLLDWRSAKVQSLLVGDIGRDGGEGQAADGDDVDRIEGAADGICGGTNSCTAGNVNGDGDVCASGGNAAW